LFQKKKGTAQSSKKKGQRSLQKKTEEYQNSTTLKLFWSTATLLGTALGSRHFGVLLVDALTICNASASANRCINTHVLDTGNRRVSTESTLLSLASSMLDTLNVSE
jgi:hypothetical protein